MQTNDRRSVDEVSSDRSLVETFAAISSTLNLNQPLESTLGVVAEQVARRLDHAFCAIALHDPTTQVFRIAGSYGLSKTYLEAANAQLRTTIEREGLADAHSVTVRAFNTRQPYWVHTTSEDPAFSDWKSLATLAGYTSVVFMPLVFRGEAIGVLSCYGDERKYGPADVQRLQPIADQTATAVGITRMLSDQERVIEQLASKTHALDLANQELIASAQATREITGLLLRGCSLEELVLDFSRRLDADVSVYDESSALLASSTSDAANRPAEPPETGTLIPVQGVRDTHGLVYVERVPRNGTGDPLLDQVVMACALYFMRERAAQERELRLTSALVRDLITSRDAADVLQSARRLRLRSTSGHRLLVVDRALDESGTTDHASVVSALRTLPERASHAALAAHAQFENTVVAVVSDEAVPATLGEAVTDLLAEAGMRQVSVGISRLARQPQDLRLRFQELRRCFILSGASTKTSALTLAEDWYPLNLVLRDGDAEDAREHSHHVLDRLAISAVADDLLLTLRTLLDEEMSVVASARRLHVHANTVKYRLRNIERLTAVNLRSVNGLMELRIALVVHDWDPARFRSEARALVGD